MNRLLVLSSGLVFGLLAHAEPPPAPGKTIPLFDGKALDGWEGDPKFWRVEDGCLTGGHADANVPHNDFLASTKDYGDFIVRFQIKLTGQEGFINSGFQIRSQRVPKNPEMAGYQCDYGEPNWYGAVYDESRRNKVMAASDMAALRPVLKLQDWNDYVIRAQGPHITTWINGVLGADYTEADPAIPRSGKFGIQIHGGGKTVVQVKNITLEELAPPAPGEIFEGAPPAKKPAKASPLLPEEEKAAFSLPPGFEIELVASESEGVGKFVPIAFDQKGALWTTTAFEYPVDGNENPAAADALYASKAKDKVLVYDRDPKSPTGYASQPRVFAEGLAIPLGVLPYQNGCYVQHGHDIAFLSDTDGDGKADKREVILTGFGVQDSHLFPHQFTRAPGGWIWMAQGAFNYGKVRQPNQPAEKAVQFDQTRMAKFRPDGSGFDITSNGPCNIWGLVLDGLGQAWIQEANDFGYPVMSFHEYANYPGCSDRQWKSYAPEFPGTPGIPMGGTGLSGLALSDHYEGSTDLQRSGATSLGAANPQGASGSEQQSGRQPTVPGGISPEGSEKLAPEPVLHTFPPAYADVMFVANPITNKIQAIKIIPDGPRFKYVKLPDFINTSDPWFRPVAITFGPDGCLYIVDWYNKIISHNEVPRNHPERDKLRGRIWRVKATAQKPFEVPDFTKLSGDELIAKLGGPSLAQSHLAWQAIGDRGLKELAPKLREIVAATSSTDLQRSGATSLGAANPPGASGSEQQSVRQPTVPVGTATNVAQPPTQPTDGRGGGWASRPSSDASRVATSPSDSSVTARRIAALWALEGLHELNQDLLATIRKDPNRNIRHEFGRLAGQVFANSHIDQQPPSIPSDLAELSRDEDPWVRAGAIVGLNDALGIPDGFETTLAREVYTNKSEIEVVGSLFRFAGAPLAVPLAPSTKNNKPIKVGVAYDREFERYLVRMFLERHPKVVADYLDSPDSTNLPIESRLLATLALEPKASAARVAKLLPQLTRPAGEEELLRLAQFPEEPGVGDALKAVLQNPATRDAALESLLKVRTRLDAGKIAPLLTDAAKQLIGGPDAAAVALGARLAESFQLAGTEEALVGAVEKNLSEIHAWVKGEQGHRSFFELKPAGVAALDALRVMRSDKVDLFERLALLGQQPEVRDAAVAALAMSKAPDAGARLLKLWPGLAPAARRSALDKITTTKPGAKTVVAALKAGTIAKADLDGPTIEKLQALLGANDPDLAPLLNELAALFRPVLTLNGSDDAWTETGLSLEGPFTVECWVRLASGIGNQDGILGSPGQVDINFFDSRLRVWVGGLNDVVISKKPITADLWTHVAVTRDEQGMYKIYQDGELASDSSKPAPQKFENVRIAWNQPAKGTEGALAEYRLWKIARSANDIRRDFDRSFSPADKPAGLVLLASGTEGWGTLHPGAKIAKTSDFPPVMSAEEASALDATFAKYRVLAQKPGDPARGKLVTAVCQACHLFKGQGASIGPDLSGVGAMGDEAILRNIITPNAAMENGYRIYRMEMKSGDLVDAFYVSEDKDAVVIRQPGVPDRRVPKAEIRSAKYLRRSLMPEGILNGMTPEQVTDLFAYLRTMK